MPELKYEYVHRLKADFPAACFILNGGIRSPEQLAQRGCLDGFMVGREAVRNVFVFREMESLLLHHGQNGPPASASIPELVMRYAALYDSSEPVKNTHVLPLIGLMRGTKNSRRCRQRLSSLPGRRCTFGSLHEEVADCM